MRSLNYQPNIINSSNWKQQKNNGEYSSTLFLGADATPDEQSWYELCVVLFPDYYFDQGCRTHSAQVFTLNCVHTRNRSMPFLRAWTLSETQAVSYKVWPGVTDSISYDDNL